jgi:hypothetical protein
MMDERRRRDQDVPCASNDEALWIMSAGVPDVIDPVTGQVISAIERDYDDDFVVDVSTIPCLTYTDGPTRMPTGRPTSGPTAMMMMAETEEEKEEDEGTEEMEDAEDTAVSTTEKEDGTSSSTTTSSSRSFYGCDHDGDGGNDDGDDATSNLPSEDAVELNLAYDYEIHTSLSSLDDDDDNGGMLSSFENAMAYDMANRYGLVDCTSTAKRRRRYLRSLGGTKRGLIAVSGSPVDVSMADACELFLLACVLYCISPTVHVLSRASRSPIFGFPVISLKKRKQNKTKRRMRIIVRRV